MRTPKDFLKWPWDSVTQKAELEMIARNIMVILARTGNEFRNISYYEYKNEIEKDGGVSQSEADFDTVMHTGYFQNADTAELFSPNWKERTA